MKNNKIYYISIIATLIMGCYQNVDTGLAPTEDLSSTLKGDSYKKDIDVGGLVSSDSDIFELQDTTADSDTSEVVEVYISAEEMLPPAPSYPEGPYSLELFKIIPNIDGSSQYDELPPYFVENDPIEKMVIKLIYEDRRGRLKQGMSI